MKYPFEVPFTEVEAEIDLYISSVFSCLESEFLVMPKGEGFVDYPVFERGYEFLKRITNGFRKIDSRSITEAAFQNPMVIIVLRTMLGFTPPEWAYVTTQRTGVEVSQGFARTLDRNIRMSPMSALSDSRVTRERGALVDAACQLLNMPVPEVGPDKIHRLDKADTSTGPSGIIHFLIEVSPMPCFCMKDFWDALSPGTGIQCQNWSGTAWNLPLRKY